MTEPIRWFEFCGKVYEAMQLRVDNLYSINCFEDVDNFLVENNLVKVKIQTVNGCYVSATNGDWIVKTNRGLMVYEPANFKLLYTEVFPKGDDVNEEQKQKEGLTEYSDQEIWDELRRRQDIENDRQANKPRMKELINIGGLVNICEEYIEQIYKQGYADEDLPTNIFETAMKTIFGNNVFDWIFKAEKIK